MKVQKISPEELWQKLKNKEDIELIDVREPEEYGKVRIKGSKLIPMSEMPDRMEEIDWSKEVVLICRSGSRSRLMADVAAQMDKRVKNLEAGVKGCHMIGCDELEYPGGDLEGYL